MDRTTELEKTKSQLILRNTVHWQTISELENTAKQGHELQLTKPSLITTTKKQLSQNPSDIHKEQAKINNLFRICELERHTFQLNEMLSERKVRIRELELKKDDPYLEISNNIPNVIDYKGLQISLSQVV